MPPDSALPTIPRGRRLNSPLVFQWGVSTFFGWGIYGLYLLQHWPRVVGTAAYCSAEIQTDSFKSLDPLRQSALAPLVVASNQVKAHLAAEAKQNPIIFNGLVLHSIGNQFFGSALSGQPMLRGQATCGVIFCEDTRLERAPAFCGQFDRIIAGSSWGEDVLRANGAENVSTVLQGVDTSMFHPASRWGAFAGRFAVFSGGKFEYRKGQDLVLKAFCVFARRHPEAVLVTAWHSPWVAGAMTINEHSDLTPIAVGDDGRLNVAAWARANGIDSDQFVDLGSVPHHVMPQVLREMDVAVFPNRCEGGTNLVAMECMACGIPTIVSDNTGHKDLVATGAPYALTTQRPLALVDIGTAGWGESDVDEIVEGLERVWTDRSEAARRSAAGFEAMSQLDWQRQILQLHDTVAEQCSLLP